MTDPIEAATEAFLRSNQDCYGTADVTFTLPHMRAAIAAYRDPAIEALRAQIANQELDGSGMPRTGLQWGLTKREYFAGQAMSALLTNYRDHAENGFKQGDFPHFAVIMADALLAELAKDQP